jgi:hypothetical protein
MSTGFNSLTRRVAALEEKLEMAEKERLVCNCRSSLNHHGAACLEAILKAQQCIPCPVHGIRTFMSFWGGLVSEEDRPFCPCPPGPLVNYLNYIPPRTPELEAAEAAEIEELQEAHRNPKGEIARRHRQEFQDEARMVKEVIARHEQYRQDWARQNRKPLPSLEEVGKAIQARIKKHGK